ncbi:hypothetical protein E6H29_07090 [Candidatus Bathyarchaeota archaeon]|nr:MAG: hypothetical protein E6H29_07090 [Candidatus Bathyarchaeota archaeon]
MSTRPPGLLMEEKKRMVDPFWLSVGLVVLVGTIGGVLYKYGTNRIPGITLDKLTQIELSTQTIPYLALLLTSVALFFFAGYGLRDRIFAANYLFYPVIFLGLIMFLLGRFLTGIPLSQRGLGQVTALLTDLGIVTTAFASWIIFKENFSPRTVAGVALGLVAIYLIGEQ